MQRCILIGAGDCNVQKIETKPEDFVIAVDGGYDTCRKYDIVPDLIVGDFDSVQESDMPQIAEIAKIAPDHVVVLPTEKDDTDMALAVAKAYEKGYRNILLYGGCGGARISHTLANIQMMSFYAEKGCSLQMLGDGIRLEILHNASKTLSAAMKGSISVICLSDIAEGVTIQGLKYEYTGALTSDRTLGVSNSFVGKDAMVSVENGTLLLVYERA